MIKRNGLFYCWRRSLVSKYWIWMHIKAIAATVREKKESMIMSLSLHCVLLNPIKIHRVWLICFLDCLEKNDVNPPPPKKSLVRCKVKCACIIFNHKSITIDVMEGELACTKTKKGNFVLECWLARYHSTRILSISVTKELWFVLHSFVEE